MTHSGPTPSPREVVELHQQSVLSLDPDAQAHLFAEEGSFELPFPAPGTSGRLEGREQIRTVLGAGMSAAKAAGHRLTGYHSVVLHDTADPEVVIVEFELHGETAKSGRTYHLPYIQVFRIRAGQIMSLREYFTGHTATALQELIAS